jgi:hypothetical protein
LPLWLKALAGEPQAVADTKGLFKKVYGSLIEHCTFFCSSRDLEAVEI